MINAKLKKNAIGKESGPDGCVQTIKKLYSKEKLVCGVDEAGRGPLAGPVFAAAVLLNPEKPIKGLADSKKLSAKKRELLSQQICELALAWKIAQASVEEIDRYNILQASLLAMRRAIEGLAQKPSIALIDGKFCPQLAPNFNIVTHALIGGDAYVPEISAASILAKVARDRLMCVLHQQYPQYGFAQHKGYPTKIHRAQLAQWGVTPHHRRSFTPVAALLQ